jgi:hypothetical protein
MKAHQIIAMVVAEDEDDIGSGLGEDGCEEKEEKEARDHEKLRGRFGKATTGGTDHSRRLPAQGAKKARFLLREAG